MWVFDEDTLAFVEVNQAAVVTYGYSRDEFLRMDITQIRPPEEIPALLERIRDVAAHPPRTWKHVTKAGRVIDVEVAATRLIMGGHAFRLTVIRDVSEQKKLEDQLRQAQKMETVGQLAAGIAHDFSNLLTAIIGHTEMLSEYLAPSDPRATEVAGIRHATELASGLTRQLQAFGREQPLQPEVLDLNEVIDRTRRIVGRLIGERIELAIEPDPALRRVEADRGQIEQTLVTLVVNARDAMPDGGRLTLRTRNVAVGRGIARRLGLAEGDYVEMSIADTGSGIDAAVKPHVFEPFYTTKDWRRGSGLGLATVYGIVKQSGGHITVESEVGLGTTFAILLPASADIEVGDSVAAHAADGGSETVLLIEYDEAVRGLISDVLSRRGYTLLVAESGTHAIELASAHQGEIDLMITDAAMSTASGHPVADAVRAAQDNIKVLYVSGYADGLMMPSGFVETSGAYLHKPFTSDALARKVRTTLSS